MSASEESISISFEGIDELCKDIEKVEKAAPGYMRDAIEKAGNTFRREVRNLTKSKLKYKTKKPTGKLLRGFRSVVQLKFGSLKSYEALEYGGYGRACHFHLIEDGHKRTAQVFYRGKKGPERVFYKSSSGTTPGYHTMESTKSSWRDGTKLVPFAQKAIERALKEGKF